MTKAIKVVSTMSPFFTEGKIYLVHSEGLGWIEVVDDDGDVSTIDITEHGYIDFEWVEEENEAHSTSFSKKDLVAGKHIVKLADGSVGLVVYSQDELWVLFEDDNCMTLRDQEEDLSFSEDSYFDIVEVYEISSCFMSKIFNLAYHDLVWQKNPKRKMSLKEIEEALGYSVEITD